jgi:hypothetical protein
MSKRALCLALLVLGGLVAGCFSRGDDRAVAVAPDVRPRVALLLYGFFNSDDPGKFAPQPIEYVEVDLDQAHERLIPRLGQSGFRRAVRPLSQAETKELSTQSSVPRPEARQRLRAALDVLDAMANEAPAPAETLRELRSPVVFPGWGPADRVLVVVGLETPLRDGTDRGLRSLVGCFWFGGDGRSLTFVPAPYDFRLFDTVELVQLVGDRCDPPLAPAP